LLLSEKVSAREHYQLITLGCDVFVQQKPEESAENRQFSMATD
jgi:hypothetical protein